MWGDEIVCRSGKDTEQDVWELWEFAVEELQAGQGVERFERNKVATGVGEKEAAGEWLSGTDVESVEQWPEGQASTSSVRYNWALEGQHLHGGNWRNIEVKEASYFGFHRGHGRRKAPRPKYEYININ